MEVNGDNLFNGKFSVEQAIEKLRSRLLDLSSRNRLISFRHPKGRSIQFFNKPNLTTVFNRLIDNRSIYIKPVPYPPTDIFTTKRPEARAHAQTLGIDISEEFKSSASDVISTKSSSKLQTLLYPAELEKLCRKLRAESRTIVEETGTNMMYLIFGFLEYYDSDDSDKAILAPLLSLPVILEREEVDTETRTYQYSLSYSGEDLQDNQSLREKLINEFTLQLPNFNEDDEPGTYLASIQKAVQTKPRWRVRYQLTLGFLSFGKLAIWVDLDTRKSPLLAKHPLLSQLFSGGTNDGLSHDAPDYDIDNHPDADKLSLVYDADSAQHSAIIDVLAGKNRVINGPPGTGKSQTITNIIAAALQRGLKVLFVSEKLAALEVVRHRLNQANLGHFCLELHSHKTQKKKLLEDISKRLLENFSHDRHIPDKLSALNRLKSDLNRYAELMASQIGNEMGLTVHEVIWRSEKYRSFIGDVASNESKLYIKEAKDWTLDEVEYRRTKLESLGLLLTSIGPVNPTHPWWGFIPFPLTPGDETHISRIIIAASESSKTMWEVVSEYMRHTCLSDEPRIDRLLELLDDGLGSLSQPPQNLVHDLLPKVFLDEKATSEHYQELIRNVIQNIADAIEINIIPESVLTANCSISYDQLKEVIESASTELPETFFSIPISKAISDVKSAKNALERFDKLPGMMSYSFVLIDEIVCVRLNDVLGRIKSRSGLRLSNQPFKSIKAGFQVLVKELNSFTISFERIESIASQHRIIFDGSPATIKHLDSPNGIEGLISGSQCDETTLNKLKANIDEVSGELASLSLDELTKRHNRIIQIQGQLKELLYELNTCAEQVSFPFNNSLKATAQLVIISEIMNDAPKDLLGFRQHSLGHPRVTVLLQEADLMLQEEKTQRAALEAEFYLDTLPHEEELKMLLHLFRQRGDSFFNFLNKDWRTAKKLLASISKKPLPRKSIDCQRVIEQIINWKEHYNSFTQNQEFKNTFGSLFKGVDTDFSKLHRLHSWYTQSHIKLRKYPELTNLIDLSTVEDDRVMQYASLAPLLGNLHTSLTRSKEEIKDQLGYWAEPLFNDNIETYYKAIERAADIIDKLFTSFLPLIKSELSPKRAVEILSAALKFSTIKVDFELLYTGSDLLKKSLEPLLPGFSDIQCDTWDEYLGKLKILERDVNQLIEVAIPYENEIATPSMLLNFMEAKLNVDNTCKYFAPYFNNAEASGWTNYSSHMHDYVTTASKLVDGISPAAIGTELSIEEVIKGLWFKKQSQSLLQKVKDDKVAIQLLEGLFNGLHTDLRAIENTLAWGNKIVANSYLSNSELKELLLGTNATNDFIWANKTLSNIAGLLKEVETKLTELNTFGFFSWMDWTQTPFETKTYVYASKLASRIERAVVKNDTVLGWSQYYTERREIEKLSLQHFIIQIERQLVPVSKIGLLFNFAVYWSIGRDFYTKFPEFMSLLGSKQDTLRAEFAALDREIISLTGRSSAYQIDKLKKPPLGRSSGSPREKTELNLLIHEIGKTKQHIPIRQLIKRAGQALQTLKPCFMMGPLSVAQYLEQDSLEFDLVVMDEASQLRPEEALGAIARGKQLVVVGDPKQLPPTNFFDRVMEGDEDEEEDESNIFAGTESILDICQQLFHPVRTLRWHYRSQHESLIAFSNHHFYDGRLIVFPSPFDRNKRLGVRYRYVKQGIYKDRQNVVEANRVVDAVMEHMINYPDESLGVVTLNQTQRDLIEELLDRKIRNVPETASFMSKWEEEGWSFFVKNLENVQGDERDVIFISTTYGKALGTESVRQNFGPISRSGGWRRLNVLFTRARRRVELFTSMLPGDIVVDEKTPLGTKALRDYLDYVKRGILTTTNPTGREPDSDFEIAVGEMLRQKGYEVVPQLGVAGFFIDMAVRNPDRPGEFLAAIECDGAMYHSSKSARDRDRIRQSILESLGWKGRLWRIWSTDWFYNPQQSSERLLTFLEERREMSKLTPLPDLLIDEDEGEVIDVMEADAEIEELIHTPAIKSREELYVEIGDHVTYCFMDRPQERRRVQLVEGASDPTRQRFNDQSPLGKTLLDSKIGDVKLLENNGVSRKIRVVRITRE